MVRFPEQQRALDYARRRGTEAPLTELRDRVARTFAELETWLHALPGERAPERPAPGKWSAHEIVDHLVESHRPAVGHLRELIAGRSIDSDPTPAGLLSPEPLSRPWATLLGALETVHRDYLRELDRATDATPLTARGPVVMVVRCRMPEGHVEPVHWIEHFDWKASAILVRAHSLEHLQQLQRTGAALAGTS